MAEEAAEFEPITSQEQLDGVLKSRLAREREKVRGQFSDYDELKQAAAKYRELQDAEKSDLQRANERIAELEASAKKRDEADRLRELRSKVSRATGVPAELISGSDEDSMTTFAKSVAEFAKRPSAPRLSEAGTQAAPADKDVSGYRRIARALAGEE